MNLKPYRSKSFPIWEQKMDPVSSNLHNEMNDVLDNFLSLGSSKMPQAKMNLFPAIDIQDKDDKYLLSAELPGMKDGEVELELHNNTLTIRGERKSDTKKEDENFIYTERYFGSFRRDIPFEQEIDQESIKAELKKGVLHVQLMKTHKDKSTHKKIEIKH